VKVSEDEKKNNGIDKKLLNVMQEYLETLRERSRRMILRKIKAGGAFFFIVFLNNLLHFHRAFDLERWTFCL